MSPSISVLGASINNLWWWGGHPSLEGFLKPLLQSIALKKLYMIFHLSITVYVWGCYQWLIPLNSRGHGIRKFWDLDQSEGVPRSLDPPSLTNHSPRWVEGANNSTTDKMFRHWSPFQSTTTSVSTTTELKLRVLSSKPLWDRKPGYPWLTPEDWPRQFWLFEVDFSFSAEDLLLQRSTDTWRSALLLWITSLLLARAPCTRFLFAEEIWPH